MELLIIQKKIFEIRGHRVMMDFHLAELYGVQTRVLVQAVKRNIKRFPSYYMFQINKEEFKTLIFQIGTSKKEKSNSSQIVMSSQKHRGSKYLPYAFTEHGVTMLSAVLRSDMAIKVGIAVVDAFILLKQYHNNYKELEKKIEELEKQFNKKFEDINEAIHYLLNPPEPKMERKPIGYKIGKE